MHLPNFRSQAAIVSEKSTVFTFSHRKASVNNLGGGGVGGGGRERGGRGVSVRGRVGGVRVDVNEELKFL